MVSTGLGAWMSQQLKSPDLVQVPEHSKVFSTIHGPSRRTAGQHALNPPLSGKARVEKPVHARVNMSRRVINLKFLTGQIFC